MTGRSAAGRGGTGRFGAWWRDLRRTASWHRRLLAAGLAAGAVALAIQALEAPPPPTTPVLAAARDLLAGAPLTAADLTTVAVPAALVPAGSLESGRDVIDRVLTGPVRAGEILTDVRVVGPALVDALPDGFVATPLRVADAATVALVRPGDRVDVLATPVTAGTEDWSAVVVGADLAVVAVPAGTGSGAYSDGGLLVLAATPATARSLAASEVTARLSITVLGSH